MSKKLKFKDFLISSSLEKETNTLTLNIFDLNEKEISKLKVNNVIFNVIVKDQDSENYPPSEIEVLYLDINKRLPLFGQKIEIFENGNKLNDFKKSNFLDFYLLFSNISFIPYYMIDVCSSLDTDEHELFNSNYRAIDFNEPNSIYDLLNN